MPTKNMRQGRIYVRSGDSTPLVKECLFTQGDFSYTTAKATIQILQRGVLDHLRKGDEQAVTFKFSAKFVDRTLRRCLLDYVWDGQAEAVTGLTGNALNSNVPLDYAYEQGSLQVGSSESGWSKLAHGGTPAGTKQFAEEVGALDLEGLTQVGSAQTAAAAVPGEFSTYQPVGDTDLSVVYDAIGRSTLHPGTSDVKTFRIDLVKLDVADPTKTVVAERYQLNHARLESVEQAEGDEFDLVTFSGFAFVVKPTVALT